jgi:CPA2 family monovalent cation:H+ antiporter-2
MQHLPHLIQDLALILIVAGITTLLFKKLKQPVVLGYLLAGLLVSPGISLFPTVTDTGNIKIWADIGVIFLLFNLGLEFSFKKLMRIGGTASVTALIEISAMLAIGFALGNVLGWPLMDCIFLGGILAVSSTTIIIRTFDELNVKGKRFANLVLGVLIVEDLVAIVLMVLLSTIAVSRQFEGGEMLLSVVKLAFFLVLWFVAGIFFIPTFFRWSRRLMNDETMLVVSLGLCLMMVILASLAGFSPALGAFIMGSILAETTQAERIEHLIRPVKDLFGAVFFISVGMLIEPDILVKYALPITVITITFIISKILNVTAGALISGQPLKTSVYAGMSMGQIGEFSFIIATLGLTLNVTGNYLYPIAVAISVLTTFSTPYMVKLAGPLYNLLDEHLPVRWKKTLARYSEGTQSISTASDWQIVLRSYFFYVLVFSIMILGVIFMFSRYAAPWILENVADGYLGLIITAVLCLLVLSPFLWALVVRKLQPQAFANLWGNKKYRGPLLFLRLVRAGLGIIYMSILLLSFFPFYVAMVGTMFLVAVAIVFSNRIHEFYIRIEERFFFNFHHREIQEAKAGRHELAPWDAHIAQFSLPAGTPVTGMNLEEMGLRERLGINIAMIKRSDYIISAPSRYEKVYPGDKLFVIGTDEQLEQFSKHIEPVNGKTPEATSPHEVVLKKIIIKQGSPFAGKTIRESGIREKTNGLVVGIERKGRRLLNPDSTTIFEDGDNVWIVGDKYLIATLFQSAF